MQGYCPTAATPIRFINGVCNLFLHPSSSRFWFPVLKANPDLAAVESWIRFLGKMWMSEFSMKQGSCLPFFGAALKVSHPSYIVDVSVLVHAPWSFWAWPDFPAWPQISLRSSNTHLVFWTLADYHPLSLLAILVQLLWACLYSWGHSPASFVVSAPSSPSHLENKQPCFSLTALSDNLNYLPFNILLFLLFSTSKLSFLLFLCSTGFADFSPLQS